VSLLSGDVSGLSGNVSLLRGKVSGLSGNVSGLRGNVDKCEIEAQERKLGIEINRLVME
jgi:hypothetical protein